MMRRWPSMTLGPGESVVRNVFSVDGIEAGIGKENGVEPVTRPVRYTSADAMYITTFTAVPTTAIIRDSSHSSVYLSCNGHCNFLIRRVRTKQKHCYWSAPQMQRSICACGRRLRSEA
jgi:hypothetical protein